MLSVCPQCGSERLRVQRRPSIWGAIRHAVGLSSVRCKDCGHRLPETQNWWDGVRFARCPICYRMAMADWTEKYLYPGWWATLRIFLGARPHRCPHCRHNFVSFLPRCPGRREARRGEPTPPPRVGVV